MPNRIQSHFLRSEPKAEKNPKEREKLWDSPQQAKTFGDGQVYLRKQSPVNHPARWAGGYAFFRIALSISTTRITVRDMTAILDHSARLSGSIRRTHWKRKK